MNQFRVCFKGPFIVGGGALINSITSCNLPAWLQLTKVSTSQKGQSYPRGGTQRLYNCRRMWTSPVNSPPPRLHWWSVHIHGSCRCSECSSTRALTWHCNPTTGCSVVMCIHCQVLACESESAFIYNHHNPVPMQMAPKRWHSVRSVNWIA